MTTPSIKPSFQARRQPALVPAPLWLAALALSLAASTRCSSDAAASGLRYQLLVSDNSQAIVLLQQEVSAAADSDKLNTVADSLYALRQPPAGEQTMDNYRVWFYYRPDWKGHIYFAGKRWGYDDASHQLQAGAMDITGIKSADR